MGADVLALGRRADPVLVRGEALYRRIVDGSLDSILLHPLDERGPIDFLGMERRTGIIW